MNTKKKIHCPRCGKENTWQANNKFRPFCSERCKLIDLGSWADEKYCILDSSDSPTSNPPEELDEE